MTEQGPRENTGRQGWAGPRRGPGQLSRREGADAGGGEGLGDGACVASEAGTCVLTTADLHQVLIQRKC